MFKTAIRYKMYELVSKVLTLQKYPIEKPKYPNKIFIRNVEYPINICNIKMNEK